MTVEIVREMPRSASGADQVLVRKDSSYYVVSSVVALFTGFETLVFPADENGTVTNWGEVAGGRGLSRDEAIEHLDSGGYADDWYVVRMEDLGEGVVYRLPDGLEVTPSDTGTGGFALYTKPEWDAEVSADLEIQPDGRITFQGSRCDWTVADLTYTRKQWARQ